MLLVYDIDFGIYDLVTMIVNTFIFPFCISGMTPRSIVLVIIVMIVTWRLILMILWKKRRGGL